MDTKQKAFIEARLAAHRAETRNIDRDPLVRAAKADRDAAREVIARWKDLRNAGTPKEWPDKGFRRHIVRRQAD